ncbi:MAG: hypothetical protein ACYDCD_08230 [Candidatus Acidiferrales bacterium]
MRVLQALVFMAATFVFGATAVIAKQKITNNEPRNRAAIQQAVERFLDAWNKHEQRKSAASDFSLDVSPPLTSIGK